MTAHVLCRGTKSSVDPAEIEDVVIALLRDAHPGYISWQQYMDNQRRLKDSAKALPFDRSQSPPREGPALLQGRVVCRLCGSHMHVRYRTRGDRSSPTYVCVGRGRFFGDPLCQSILGTQIDDAIGELLVNAVTPLALELTLAVQQEIQRRVDDADRLRHRQIERACGAGGARAFDVSSRSPISRMRFRLLLLFTLLACADSRRPVEPASFLDHVLPAGTYRAEVQRFGLPSELAGVQTRFAEAVATKQEWFQDYIRSHADLKPGEILPYHAEMGISREEYEALTKAYTHPIIAPAGSFQLVAYATGGALRLRAPPPYQFLNDLEIDQRTGALRGPRELSIRPETVTARTARFGTWSGRSWFFEAGDVARGNSRRFELAIGRLDGSGQLVIYSANSIIERKQRIADDQLLAWLVKDREPSR